ncbi:serine hydrolase [Galactobacter sp.]|uniref:serine hydrolase domain-containing protein n=1 Tax=Galactobacter sp. TaxID=2676125 RepID=UPI0025C0050E|nr:serine hydrolase domain-containing protein [Galactobacter sp.]
MSITEILAHSRVPGAQMIHRRGSEVVSEINHGHLSVATTSAPVTSASVFQAASLSKVVFSYLTLRAVDSGQLELDTPLSAYFDSPRTHESEAARAITARQALNHTTGLPNWVDGAGTEDSVLNPHVAPGTRFTYSGDGFFPLQQTLEALDGRPLELMAQQDLFSSFGMEDSSFVFREADASRTAAGHGADGTGTGISRFRRANSAFTLTTAARDYSRFLELAVCHGEGLRPDTHVAWLSTSSDARLTTERSEGETPTVTWGLGVGLEANRHGPAVWHWGDNGNHRAFFVAVPDRDESVVMFFNSANGQKAAAPILERVLPGRRFASLDWVDAYDRG